MKTETFAEIVDSYARMIRLDMAKSITEADKILLDEIADPAAELARIIYIAAMDSLDMPYSRACHDIGAEVLKRLQQIIDDRASRMAEEERK